MDRDLWRDTDTYATWQGIMVMMYTRISTEHAADEN